MTNIHHNNAVPDFSTVLLHGLILSDRVAGAATEQVARDMRIIAAPKHPGRDPVSVHVVEQLVSVLRGEGGLAPRMAAVTERLRVSAGRLEESLHQYQTTDHDAVQRLSGP